MAMEKYREKKTIEPHKALGIQLESDLKVAIKRVTVNISIMAAGYKAERLVG
ncbi:MAG: hypothetical protein K2L07_15810 [Lachnospiraceae bacterium]|nr:hypothetical protein [Lachnospiraceae bacterium]